MYTNLPTSRGYIFRILQHFATKLCSFSNFGNFFPEISFVIPRLKFFLKRKLSIENRKASMDCGDNAKWQKTIKAKIGARNYKRCLIISRKSLKRCLHYPFHVS